MTKSSAASALGRFGAKPPSSPTLVLWPAALSADLSVWKISAPIRSAFGERRRADRHHHEFLEVDRVVGMRAAIDDIHHRHRRACARTCRRHSGRAAGRSRSRPRLGGRERHPEQRIGAEPRLVGRAVERDHGVVDQDLVLGIHAADGVENLALDRIDRLGHALAEIAGLVAVAQFDRLMRAGRGAGRHRGAAERAVFQQHIHLDRRIAAAVQNFAADDIDDGGHGITRRSFAVGAACTGWTRPRKSR